MKKLILYLIIAVCLVSFIYAVPYYTVGSITDLIYNFSSLGSATNISSDFLTHDSITVNNFSVTIRNQFEYYPKEQVNITIAEFGGTLINKFTHNRTHLIARRLNNSIQFIDKSTKETSMGAALTTGGTIRTGFAYRNYLGYDTIYVINSTTVDDLKASIVWLNITSNSVSILDIYAINSSDLKLGNANGIAWNGSGGFWVYVPTSAAVRSILHYNASGSLLERYDVPESLDDIEYVEGLLYGTLNLKTKIVVYNLSGHNLGNITDNFKDAGYLHAWSYVNNSLWVIDVRGGTSGYTELGGKPRDINVYLDDEIVYSNEGYFSTLTADYNLTILNDKYLCSNLAGNLCNFTLTTESTTLGILNISINLTYLPYILNYTNLEVIETSLQTFNISYANLTNSTNIESSLVYNGTTYNYNSKKAFPSYTNFLYTFNLPLITSNETIYNYPFYFDYNHTYPTKMEKRNSTNYNQTTYKIILTNCTSGSISTNRSLHFITRDETTLANVTANSIKSLSNVWHPDTYPNTNYMRNYSVSINKTDYMDICIYPDWTEYQIDTILQYSLSGYDSRDWIKENFTINNISQTIYLYLLLSATSSEVTWHITDENGNPYGGVLIDMELYDIGTGNFYLVESEYSDDDGQSKFSYDADNYYRFIFSIGGTEKERTTKTKITATDLYIQLIDFIETIYNKWLIINDLERSLTYDNDTRVVTLDWDDSTTNYLSNICLNVSFSSNRSSLYSECSLSDISTITYTRPTYTLNMTLLAQAIGWDNEGNRFTLNSLSLIAEEIWRMLGESGIAFAFMIILVLGLLGATNGATGTIIGVDVGLIISSYFNFIPVSPVALWGIIIISVLIIVGINKMEARL